MTRLKPIPVWLDCDPGQDDLVAIILACYSKQFDLLGISTVHGNVSLENTTTNTLRILTAINKTDINVYPGESKPLNNHQNVFAQDVHGKTGLNGSNLLPVARMKSKNHPEFFPQLAQSIENNQEEICIIATGPLTNIASFFSHYPHLASKIKWLSVMGGGFRVSNISENAEFNFYCDPYAAKQVVENPILLERMLLSSLDITTTVFITDSIQSRILAGQTIAETSNFRAMMFQLIDSLNKRMLLKKLVDYKGPVIHDPVALIAVLNSDPNFKDFELTFNRKSFTIGTEPGSFGSCQNVADNPKGAHIMTGLNVDRFWDFVLSAYAECDNNAYMNTVSRDQLIEEFNQVER